MLTGTGGRQGWPARPNAAAEWPEEPDSDAGQSFSRAGPSWAVPVRTTSFRTEGRLLAGHFRAGPKADCRRGISGPGRDYSWPKGQTRNCETPGRNLRVFLHKAFNERNCKEQVLAFVLFDPPARLGGSLPCGGPRRAARALRSPAIAHSLWPVLVAPSGRGAGWVGVESGGLGAWSVSCSCDVTRASRQCTGCPSTSTACPCPQWQAASC